jgi:hypothetical protein
MLEAPLDEKEKNVDIFAMVSGRLFRLHSRMFCIMGRGTIK